MSETNLLEVGFSFIPSAYSESKCPCPTSLPSLGQRFRTGLLMRHSLALDDALQLYCSSVHMLCYASLIFTMRELMKISTPILLATLHSLTIHCHIPMLTQTRSAHSPSLLPSLGGGGGVIAHNAKQSDLPRPFLPPHPPPSVSSSQLLPLLGLICMG